MRERIRQLGAAFALADGGLVAMRWDFGANTINVRIRAARPEWIAPAGELSVPKRIFGIDLQEHRMGMNSIRCTWVGCALMAVASFASSQTPAAIPADQDKDVSRVIVAQVSSPEGRATLPVLPADAFPAYERGVRQAAAESNEALRRYIWRTRMIYNYYYQDVAPKE